MSNIRNTGIIAAVGIVLVAGYYGASKITDIVTRRKAHSLKEEMIAELNSLTDYIRNEMKRRDHVAGLSDTSDLLHEIDVTIADSVCRQQELITLLSDVGVSVTMHTVH